MYGTSAWNAAVLLLLLMCYVGLTYWLRVAHVGSTGDSVLLGGFVLLVLIGVMLYYGARQANISRQLDVSMLEAARNIAVQRLTDPAGAIEDAIFKNHEPRRAQR